MGGFCEIIRGLLDPVQVLVLDGGPQIVELGLDVGALALAHLVAVVFQRLLHRIGQRVSLVDGLDLFLLPGVLGGELLRLAHHLLDLFLGQLLGRGDLDGLLLSRPQILCRHADDAVRVNVEGNLDLRNPTGGGRDAHEVEPAQLHIVVCHGPLPLEHPDSDLGLVVRGRGEDLALARRNGRVALDELRAHSAQGLDPDGEGRHIEKQNVLHLALDDRRLYGGAHGNAFHGVHPTLDLLAEEILNELLHYGHAGGTADHDDLVDVGAVVAELHAVLGEPRLGVAERHVKRTAAALHDGPDQLFQLRPVHRHGEMLGARGIRRDEREIDVRGQRAGQLHLGLLSGFPHALRGHGVFFEIYAGLTHELLFDVLHKGVVHVGAAKLRVSTGGHDLEPAFLPHLHDGDVQRAAAEVENQDLQLLAGLLQAVGETCRGRLVDDAQHLQSRDLARVLGRRALIVVEIRGAGDDHLFHGVAEVGLRILLDLLEDERGDLLGAVFLAKNLELEVAAHLALGGVDGAVGVDGRLPARGLTHEPVPFLGEGDERWKCLAGGNPGAFRRGNDDRPAAFHNCGGGVRCPKIDSDYASHCASPL